MVLEKWTAPDLSEEGKTSSAEVCFYTEWGFFTPLSCIQVLVCKNQLCSGLLVPFSVLGGEKGMSQVWESWVEAVVIGENMNMELTERKKLDTPTGNFTIKHLVSGIILFSESKA